MGTAVHWSKCLRKIEKSGGELTEALQKTFPPDWNSFHALGISGSESDNVDDISDNNTFYAAGSDSDSNDADVSGDLGRRMGL
ncbi:hypothetical protein MLD38_002512 [Melastoma candidum]|nr:hypothetical protein MLD38_002512 [Melastoma candidum]